MREILFRGKRKADGEWVYGYYLFTEENTHPVIIDLGCHSHIIAPETVGQYTGLTDSFSNRIFEGDVVREYGGEYAQGFYEIDSKLIVEIPNTLANVIHGSNCGCKYKIIGNIHDNPELRRWCSQ